MQKMYIIRLINYFYTKSFPQTFQQPVENFASYVIASCILKALARIDVVRLRLLRCDRDFAADTE